MSKKMASIVMAYGLVLAALGFVLQQVTPTLAKVTFIAGMAGGGLSVLWGIVGLTGHKRRSWAVLTLIAVAVVLLSQVVHAWSPSASETSGSLAGPLLLTFLLLLTVGMLMYLLHGERSPEFYSAGTARRDDSGSRRDVAPSDGGRHQR
jgi:peptidoglycan/LPS O-acetylase OafA/YrhL